jgi:hypothetical protein
MSMLPISTSAQDAFESPKVGAEPSRYRNEVGLNLFALVMFNYDPLYSRPQDPRPSFVNGLNYKRRIGLSAYRSSIDVFRDSFEDGSGGTNGGPYFSAKGTASRMELRLGFGHQFTSGRMRPYGALDLIAGYEHIHFEGEGEGGAFVWQERRAFGYSTSTMRYGTAVSFGLAWRFARHLSCSAEGGWWFGLIEDHDVPGASRSAVFFDPLRSFSINYHWR